MADPIPPIEIPWQLSATTRRMGDTDLGDTDLSGPTISLFTYSPTLPLEIEAAYPGETLLYLKLSISAAPLLSDAIVPDREVAEFLDEVLIRPIKRLVLDLKISLHEESRPFDSKPYFIAAAPLRREMIESGVVGAEAFSGDSSAASVGKSLTTFHEDFTSRSRTRTEGGGIGFYYDVTTNTTLAGTRGTSTSVDVTNRQAAEERKDLISHMTNVHNILTLLTAHHLGSPYLRFSLWPLRMQSLTIDPTDQNLWYAELLRRRSSGIEGLQEFYVIAVVPREYRELCLEVNLKQVGVAQSLLPEQFEYEFFVREDHTNKIRDYLMRRYPPGTPVEDLDVEIEISSVLRGMVVGIWWVDREEVHFNAYGMGGAVLFLGYKTILEVWLDAQRAEFEMQLLKSPLLTGAVVSETVQLRRCWGDSSLGSGETVTREPGRVEDWRARREGTGWEAPTESPSARSAVYRRAVFTWNAMEDQLTDYLLNSNGKPTAPLSIKHPKIMKLVLESLSNLNGDHPANRSISAGAKLLGLSKGTIDQLRKKGFVDFRGLAKALVNMTQVEQYNREVKQLRQELKQLPKDQRPKTLPEPLTLQLSREVADKVYREIINDLERSPGKQLRREST